MDKNKNSFCNQDTTSVDTCEQTSQYKEIETPLKFTLKPPSLHITVAKDLRPAYNQVLKELRKSFVDPMYERPSESSGEKERDDELDPTTHFDSTQVEHEETTFMDYDAFDEDLLHYDSSGYCSANRSTFQSPINMEPRGSISFANCNYGDYSVQKFPFAQNLNSSQISYGISLTNGSNKTEEKAVANSADYHSLLEDQTLNKLQNETYNWLTNHRSEDSASWAIAPNKDYQTNKASGNLKLEYEKDHYYESFLTKLSFTEELSKETLRAPESDRIFAKESFIFNKSFLGNNCSFGPSSVFGSYCVFGSNCQFGAKSKFGVGCGFGPGCRFGALCEFNSGCSFDIFCYFHRNCVFGAVCSFNHNCQMGKQCSFGPGTTFAISCVFGKGVKMQRGKFLSHFDRRVDQSTNAHISHVQKKN